ncbi:hypothetical protein VTJ83DRAFT_4991 [Remersonia thermophila]|uniref:Uncharacterized protein n=1 Tax=Remersonia thermophila TaxID=72144 RepID=A0ABR4DBI2_9PEZI
MSQGASSPRLQSPRLRPAERGPSPAPASRRGSVSLQAAATLNAGLQLEGAGLQNGSISEDPSSFPSPNRSPSVDRRRSQVLMNLQLADPALPGPGEMVTDSSQGGSTLTHSPRPISGSPHLIPSRRPSHIRTPSLGELHQELEAEQEYQVNRLLQQIRQLQDQLQRQQLQSGAAAVAVGDEPPATAPAPVPIPTASPHPFSPSPGPGSVSGSLPRSPGFPRASLHRSRTPSRHASPRLRATSIGTDASGFGAGENWALGGRDESAFYQAETQMLVRENQMLKHRIRELERQLADLQGGHAAVTREPAQLSSLSRSVSVSEAGDSSAQPTPASMVAEE